MKFCFLSFLVSQPGLERNNVGMVLFNFLNFFAMFLGIYNPGRVGMEIKFSLS